MQGRELNKNERLHREEMVKVLPPDVVREIQTVLQQDRSKFIVFRRMELVVKLRERYQLSYPAIGLLLKRDHSSVLHLYQKAKKEPKSEN